MTCEQRKAYSCQPKWLPGHSGRTTVNSLMGTTLQKRLNCDKVSGKCMQILKNKQKIRKCGGCYVSFGGKIVLMGGGQQIYLCVRAEEDRGERVIVQCSHP